MSALRRAHACSHFLVFITADKPYSSCLSPGYCAAAGFETTNEALKSSFVAFNVT